MMKLYVILIKNHYYLNKIIINKKRDAISLLMLTILIRKLNFYIF